MLCLHMLSLRRYSSHPCLQLHCSVELLGEVSRDEVGAVLGRGDVFLNTSFTESFCITILEAAACVPSPAR